MTNTVEAHEHAVAPPREWWQRWAEHRARWWAERPVLSARWARVRAIGLWVGLVWVLGLLLLVPELRLGARAYLGCLWIVIVWFALARTKTLTWSGFMRFFAACVPWSILVGVLSTLASGWAGSAWVREAGPSVAIAGITEETLKLLPVVLVVALAPRRASRFAAVDFALLGFAAGAAFLLVEETIRRTALMTAQGLGAVDRMFTQMLGRTVPEGWIEFSLAPLPTSWSHGAAAFGGHAVTTGLLGGLIGLGVATWRHRQHTPGPARITWRVGAVAVPVLALWSAIADHAMYNVQFTVGVLESTDPGWPPGPPPGSWAHPPRRG